MTFNFQPKTDEEIEKMNLLPDGKYRFTVRNAEETVSKSGNSMVKLTLEVYGHDGGSAFIIDYLVASDNMAWKVKHFCDAVKLLEEYQKGTLVVQNIIRLEGYATITTEKQSDYPARNKVKDYSATKEPTKNNTLTEKKGDPNKPLEIIEDEDLPF